MNSYTILGLSDPDKWLQNAYKTLNQEPKFRETLENIKPWANNDIDNILWVESCHDIPCNIFDPRIAVLSTQKRDKKLLRYYHINEQWKDYLETTSAWYNFGHWFIRTTQHERNKKELNTAWIDFWVIKTTIQSIWKENFRELEQAIWNLFLYMNHDYSIHQLWLNTKIDEIVHPIDIILQKHIDMWILSLWVKNDTTEIIAAIFHKDLLEQFQTLGYGISENIIASAQSICKYIDQIDKPHIKKYWNNILKYTLFASISPDHTAILEIKSQYPNIDLNPNRWWIAIHTPEIISKSGEKIWIRELRDVVIQDLNNTIPTGAQTELLLWAK